jgi:hypothetical protein
MRTKKISNTRFSHKLDKIFWFIISLLPVFSWLFYLFGYVHFSANPSTSVVFFFNWLQSNFLIVDFSSNPFYSVLSQIFSAGGAFPLLDANILSLFVWFLTVEVIHVCFDVMAFIPRLAHKWISKAVQDD